MKRALQRTRAFSQQALRRREEPPASGRGASSTAKTQPLELDGRSYLLPTLTLPRGGGSSSFQTRSARRTPIVLDLRLVSSDGSPHAQPIKKHELRAEIERLQNAGFLPVGVTNASEDVKQLAAAMNLPYFISTRLQAAPQTQSASHESGEADVPIFAQNRSLVVLGSVSSGAEVLADEDVFIMGALKGRALAGIGGNVSARIICQSFDAELISIAHHFTTCDELDELKHRELRAHKPTIVSLQDDQLHFQSTQ